MLRYIHTVVARGQVPNADCALRSHGHAGVTLEGIPSGFPEDPPSLGSNSRGDPQGIRRDLVKCDTGISNFVSSLSNFVTLLYTSDFVTKLQEKATKLLNLTYEAVA